MPLFLHEPVALVPELQARRRVDGIVNAAVAGAKATQQCAVVRIHNGVGGKAGTLCYCEIMMM